MIGTLGDTLGPQACHAVFVRPDGRLGRGAGADAVLSPASAGCAALAVLFRLLQGFALGGEVGPTTAFLLEARRPAGAGFMSRCRLPPSISPRCVRAWWVLCWRTCCRLTRWTQWGWRIAMLLGAAVVPFALRIRRAPARDPARNPRPAGKASRADGRAVVAGAAGACDAGQRHHRHLHDELHDDLRQPHAGLSVVLGFRRHHRGGQRGNAWAHCWAAVLGDRLGRKPVMIGGSVWLLALVLPCFAGDGALRTRRLRCWRVRRLMAAGVGAVAAAVI